MRRRATRCASIRLALLVVPALLLQACLDGGLHIDAPGGERDAALGGLSACVSAGRALITTQSAAVRNDARADAAIALEIPQGLAVTAVESCPTDGFYEVTWADGNVGWVSGDQLAYAPAQSATDGGTDSGAATGTGTSVSDGGVASNPTAGSCGGTAPGTDAGTVTGGGSSTGSGSTSGKLFVGYYQSWSDTWQSAGASTVLAKLPSYVNVVNLAFMLPGATYAKGSLSLSGTGLSFPYDGPTLRDAVATLHQRNPLTKVMVSVGGATYMDWASFSAKSIADFVADFGLDGVDLDYEPSNPNCTSNGTTVTCPSSDAQYVKVVLAMRNRLPAGKWVSLAAWSVGAYGEGEWANAQPTGSLYTGIALAVLKDARASAALDLVNVMSYDASPAFDPTHALKAYQHYFAGRIAMGIEVPPEAWGGHVETLGEIRALAGAVKSSGAAGLMLWSVQKQGPAQEFATEICKDLDLSGCSTPMF